MEVAELADAKQGESDGGDVQHQGGECGGECALATQLAGSFDC